MQKFLFFLLLFPFVSFAQNIKGFDIKAKDDTLFSIFKFEKLSKNIEDCIFEQLTKDARIFKNAKFYLVDFTIDSKYNKKWIIGNEEYKVSHKNVFKISGNSFYDLLANTNDSQKLVNESFLKIWNEIKFAK